MKRYILALATLFWMTVSASAMSYEQARQQALFLTDKMAYELNLTDDQYEAAYEINLDYLMGVNSYDDLYGTYWRQRNLDLSYILLDWQYRTYINASYFYRPLYWDGGYWHFGIYARYPHRDYFFFGRPHFYTVYHGGHSWRMNGGRSWYHGREYGRPLPGGQPRTGMRDGFNRGDYGRGQSFGNMTRTNSTQNGNGRPQNNTPSNRNFGNQNNQSFGNRQSSTRTTVTRDRSFGNNNTTSRPSNSFGNPSNRSNVFGGSRNNNSSLGNGSRSFGGGNTTSTPSRNFTPRSTPSTGGSFGGGSRNSGTSHSGNSFGGRR